MAGTGKAHLRTDGDVLLRVEDLVVEFPVGQQNFNGEIAEELGIELETSALRPALLADDGVPEGIVLFLYSCNSWRGEIIAHEGQEWGWFTRAEACLLPLPPMDADLVSRLGD